jgi:hypothetical protein
MGSNGTHNITHVGASKCVAKIALVWKMELAVRSTVGMLEVVEQNYVVIYSCPVISIS